MSLKLITAATVGSMLMGAAPAFAGSQNYTQPPSNSIAVWAYPSSQNYCPAGLQPVVVGGVICCGQPTHVGYQSNNHPKPKRPKHKPHAKPYVAYEKGYVATGKGYGEGYRE